MRLPRPSPGPRSRAVRRSFPSRADPSWQADYRCWRPPVERVIAWLVAHGNRRLPCRGTIKGERWIHHRAAALNLRRLINLGLHHHNGAWTLTSANP
ncbi:transposase [Streptomyces sp. WM6378]|uniref:transposase n=1 Tax=Streptomyces sp. WM6378 TaxID=1415557 RepID=UPI003B631F94